MLCSEHQIHMIALNEWLQVLVSVYVWQVLLLSWPLWLGLWQLTWSCLATALKGVRLMWRQLKWTWPYSSPFSLGSSRYAHKTRSKPLLINRSIESVELSVCLKHSSSWQTNLWYDRKRPTHKKWFGELTCIPVSNRFSLMYWFLFLLTVWEVHVSSFRSQLAPCRFPWQTCRRHQCSYNNEVPHCWDFKSSRGGFEPIQMFSAAKVRTFLSVALSHHVTLWVEYLEFCLDTDQ